MKNEIEVFYTGGGIWLSAMYVDEAHYYVVDNTWPDVLTCYDHSDEDDDTIYPCQNMVRSIDYECMNDNEKAMYNKLWDALLKEAW